MPTWVPVRLDLTADVGVADRSRSENRIAHEPAGSRYECQRGVQRVGSTPRFYQFRFHVAGLEFHQWSGAIDCDPERLACFAK